MFYCLFQHSKIKEFQSAWDGIYKFNMTDPDVLHTDPLVHMQKVLDGDYAYIADKTQMDIRMSTECSLQTIKEEFLPMQYAIGLQNHSPYTKTFSDEYVLLTRLRVFLESTNFHRPICPLSYLLFNFCVNTFY